MAKDTRSAKLARLVTVQRHIEKMAESELAELTRQRGEVADAMERVISAFGEVDSIHRHFADHYAERFGKLMLRDQILANTQEVQENRVLRERTKGDRLEENMDAALADEERERSDNEIWDLLELNLTNTSPATGKLRDS